MRSSFLFDLTRGAPDPAHSTVCDLGWGDGFAASLPGCIAAVRGPLPGLPLLAVAAAGAPRRHDTTSLTPPSATSTAGALFTSRIAAAPDGVVARRYPRRRTGLPSGAARRTEQ